MAIPARLVAACPLRRTHQSFAGASFPGREHTNVPGASICNNNALPTSTSLPQLGPELAVRVHTSSELFVDTSLLAAPIRRVVLRQDECRGDIDEGGVRNRNGSTSSRNGGPSLALAMAVHPQASAVDAQPRVGGIAVSRSEVPTPQLGAGVDLRSSLLQLQPPPRPAGRAVNCLTLTVASPRVSDPGTMGVAVAEALQHTAEWSFRSREQQYQPPCPPSASSPAVATRGRSRGSGNGGREGGGRREGGGGSTPAAAALPVDSRRYSALLSRVLAATNWYELRAVLITGGGGGGGADAAVLAASPDAVLTVLRRMAAVTAYDMRPPEAAELGVFLERWILQHSDVLRLMSPIQLSLCLHSLAKLTRALPTPPPAWTAAWFAAAQPYLLQCSFRPKDISLGLWALSRLQLRLPPAALQLMLAAAEPHLSRFNGQDLSLIALALSALQARSGGGTATAAATAPRLLPSVAWQERFLVRCAAVLPECGPQALANLLHGIIRSGMAVPRCLLADVCAALYGKLPDCNPQALANVLSALAAAGYSPDEAWVERFLVESAARMGHGGGGGSTTVAATSNGWAAAGRGGSGGGGGVCNLDDLTHIASATAQLALAPPRWWVQRLHASMEQLLPQASPRQLAQALHAVVQLYRSVAEPAAPVAEEDGMLAVRPPRSLLATWHRTAAAALPRFNAIDAAHSLWALAVLGERPPPAWLQRLLVTCRSGLAVAPPGDLALLVWSLSALRFRPTWGYLADVVDASEPALGAMTGQDYAMLTSGLVRLGCRPRPSWSAALLGVLREKLAQLGDRSLSQTAWALYRLRVQPSPEWLSAMAEELQRRWLRRRVMASATAARRGGGGEKLGCSSDADADASAGGGGGAEELRHTVLLLWIMSMWVGVERRRLRVPGWKLGPGSRRRVGGLGGLGGGGSQAGPALAKGHQPHLPPFATGRDVNGTRAQPPRMPLPLPLPDSVFGLKDDLVLPPPRRRRCWRVTSRTLRRRRLGTRRENLVTALGGDVRTATDLRRRIAERLLGPAMDATVAALAAGSCTPQDVALLLAVAQRLPRTSRCAAATRPAWQRALLAAAAQRLRDLPPNGLLQALSGLAALRLPLCADVVATAAAAAASYLVAPQLPAPYKVVLMQRLFSLRVTSSPRLAVSPAASPPPLAGKGHDTSFGLALAVGLRALQGASESAEPLLRLHVELLKARVRLRKLGMLDDFTGSGGVQASAALQRLAAAKAAGMEAAAAGRNAAGLMATATADVRATVIAAAAGAAAAGAAAAVIAQEGDNGGSVERRRWMSRRVPPIGENQRTWIWRRARRTVAAHVADGSPVLVMQLVQLVAEQSSRLAAAAAVAARPTPPTPTRPRDPSSSEMLGAGLPAPPTPAPPSPTPCPDLQGIRASLLWLATATNRRWRTMLPLHRGRVAGAWRRVLRSLRAIDVRTSCSSTCSIVSCGGRGPGGDVSGSRGEKMSLLQLRARLPLAVTARRRMRPGHGGCGCSCGPAAAAAGAAAASGL